MEILNVTPTPLFPRASDGSPQMARLRLRSEAAGRALVRARTDDGRDATTTLVIEAGETSYEIVVPEITRDTAVTVLIEAGDKIVARAETLCRPSRKWTLYVMPTSHVDLYSTGLAHETPEEHAKMLDAALALTEEFPDYRFQIENALPVYEFQDLRPAGAMARLVERMRAGQIAFGAQYTGVHHEEASAEELIQGQLLFARELELTYGVRPSCGYTVDVPNTTAQYAQLLVRCGVPYWIFSPNRYPPPDGWFGLGPSIRALPRLLRARAPDGSTALTWLPAEHYGEDARRFGLDGGSVDRAASAIVDELGSIEAQGYPYDAYLLEYSYGDNLPPARDLPLLIDAWRERFAWPRLVFATAAEFFPHVEYAPPAPPEMPLEVIDAWAFIVASQGVLNQIARRAGHDLLAAQALDALGATSVPPADLREAFSELAKFAAHDWWYGGGQVGGVPDLAKAGWAERARRITSDALAGLGDQQTGAHRAAVNTCGFERSDLVLLPSDTPTEDGSVALAQSVDAATVATHFRPRPHTVAHPPDNADEGDALVCVSSMPPLSSGVLRYGAAVPSNRHRESVIENDHYRVTFEPRIGAIGSIIDRESGRELLDAREHGFGQLLLGRPSWEGAGIGFTGTHEQAAERMRQSLRSWTASRLELAEGLRGPVFSSLVLRGHVHDSPVTQAVILYDAIKRIDITVTIDWDNQPRSARLVVAFPFALDAFSTRYEVPFGCLEVGRDETPTVPRHLRLMQTWLQFHNDAASIVLASPDAGVFSLGRCDLNPIDDGDYTVPTVPSAFVVLTDNGAPSPLVQPGRLAARFSLTTAPAHRPSDGARFGWGVARPPLAFAGGLPRAGVGVEPDALLVSTAKRPIEGDGLVVRVVEYDGASGEGRLRLPFVPREAWLADLMERPLTPARVDRDALVFPFGQHEVLTFVARR